MCKGLWFISSLCPSHSQFIELEHFESTKMTHNSAPKYMLLPLLGVSFSYLCLLTKVFLAFKTPLKCPLLFEVFSDSFPQELATCSFASLVYFLNNSNYGFLIICNYLLICPWRIHSTCCITGTQ